MQSVDWVAVSPVVVVVLAALLVLVADLFLPPGRKRALAWPALGGLLLALALLVGLSTSPRATFCLAGGGAVPACSYVVNTLTLALQLVVLGAAVVVVLLSVHHVEETGLPPGEYWFLLLCSVAGAVLMAAGRDIITLVVALELLSLPTFALVGLRRGDGRSAESALKFFLISVISTAVTLYGASLVYAVTGSLHLARVAAALGDPATRGPVAAVGVVLTLAGFAFKVAAVPFHFWAPDVYTGAPVPVAAYLSVVSKAAGFAGVVLVVGLGFGPYADLWGPVVAVLAAATMTVGNLVALRQRQAVRLLAWSSVAQSGFMLVPLGAVGSRSAGDLGAGLGSVLGATVGYLAIYAVMNLGAFSVVTLLGRQRPANLLADYRGLARSEPVAALALAFFLACLAGLPPGVAGLFAKVAVFRAAVEGGAGWLAVVMAVNTVIGLYYYLAWAALLFAEPLGEEEPVSFSRTPLELALALGLALGATVVLSVAPQVVLGLVASAGGLLG